MCGSLLSKFKNKSNKVHPVLSTESLTTKRVNESLSEGEATLVRGSIQSVEVLDVSKGDILEVRPYDGATKETQFRSSTAENKEKQTEPEFGIVSESEAASVIEETSQEPDFASKTECNTASSLQESKIFSASSNVCASAEDLSREQMESKIKSSVYIEEVENEPDAKSEARDAGIEDSKAKPPTRSATKDEMKNSVPKENPAASNYSPVFNDKLPACCSQKTTKPGSTFMVQCEKIISGSLAVCKSAEDFRRKQKESKADLAADIEHVKTEQNTIGDDPEAGLAENSVIRPHRYGNEYEERTGPKENHAVGDGSPFFEYRVPVYLCEKTTKVDSAFTAECDKIIPGALNVCVSTEDISEEKMESGTELDADMKQTEIEQEAKLIAGDNSKAGFKANSSRLSNSSINVCKVLTGSKKNYSNPDCSSDPECQSPACLKEETADPDSVFKVKFDSSRGLKTSKTGPNFESSYEANCDVAQTEQVVGVKVCFAWCESQVGPKELKTESDSASPFECDSATDFYGKQSNRDFPLASGHDMASDLQQKTTEPAAESTTEGNPIPISVFQPVDIIKSTSSVTAKHTFEDCNYVFKRECPSVFGDKESEPHFLYTMEGKSEVDIFKNETDVEKSVVNITPVNSLAKDQTYPGYISVSECEPDANLTKMDTEQKSISADKNDSVEEENTGQFCGFITAGKSVSDSAKLEIGSEAVQPKLESIDHSPLVKKTQTGLEPDASCLDEFLFPSVSEVKSPKLDTKAGFRFPFVAEIAAQYNSLNELVEDKDQTGNVFGNIISGQAVCDSAEEKNGPALNLEGIGHFQPVETTQVISELDIRCLGRFASPPPIKLRKPGLDSKPQSNVPSIDEIAEKNPGPDTQLDVRCELKAEVQVINRLFNAVPLERPAGEKNIIEMQLQEASSAKEASSSENSGSYGEKRPAHGNSFQSANQSMIAASQNEPYPPSSEPPVESKLDMDNGARLESDQHNQVTDSQVIRHTEIEKCVEETNIDIQPAKKEVPDHATASLRHAESAVASENQEVLFALARKELEERIIKVGTNR